ncbi:hypothetical protein BASA50_000792 [Batrachochytrium salamandrivorans]|uniref:SET domain-containing protein n=1 Tax=Batrachochytrium salamandrivorans TaxID=1357716 RepID=A0ABQ8EVG9_9FUNG|nr:hypothetical protein BASA50_000792 [Batrachochytrium salamandrivorans]KAH9271510.1 hypothetical protein BASA83_006365 [Batrachochytrium salamandrivorans]
MTVLRPIYQLHFPDHVHVVQSAAMCGSSLVARKYFHQGDTVAPIHGVLHDRPTWASIQVARDTHAEIRSELLFMNHSCDPSTHVDTSRMRVIAARTIAPGDEITFFYPSTEWDMAQPFTCHCGAVACLHRITGSRIMSLDSLANRFINHHIRVLMDERDALGPTKKHLGVCGDPE